MAQALSNVENNFTKGLITEATGLNFPENAATDTQNCTYTLIGDVTRRLGYDLESNGISLGVGTSSTLAMSEFVWNNPGGQSNTSFLARQIGGVLYFYNITNSSTIAPLSQQLISTLNLSNFIPAGNTLDTTIECQYAAGNGYLFVYQSTCQPFCCIYANGAITGQAIAVQIRDEVGANDGLQVSNRPGTLSDPHFYNLQNQGWTQGNPWSSTSSSSYKLGTTGNSNFTIATGLTITGGTVVTIIYEGPPSAGITTGQAASSGTVVSYVSGTGAIVINVTTIITLGFSQTLSNWALVPSSTGNINTFQAAAGVYPSDADVWWYFKDNTGAFAPASTLNNVTLATGNAPQGHYVLDAFIQNRAQYVASIPTVSTTKRPTTGAWWQGRVWYAGVNDSASGTTTTNFYSWVGNIYYSTTVQTINDFSICYQTNDPTSENLNGELPTDGGIVIIPETGTIHKLFPIQNGMLVFANNGIWFITGSQGIGFASNDYTVTKISSIRTLSSKSFIDVMGLPFFWNEEGIYQVTPGQNNSLAVEPITVGTILTYYNNIPLQSKKYARGDYDPINYVIQWAFRSTPETGTVDRYNMDTILNYNVYNKAFFPYTITPVSTIGPYINGITYISYPVTTAITPDPGFKYPFVYQNTPQWQFSFADEINGNYVDWNYLGNGGVNYTSYFVVGYKLHGGAYRKFQVPYTYIYVRNDGSYMAYYIQGLWDYASNSDSNKWSNPQFSEILDSNKIMVPKRHRIRGRGYVLQLKVSSVDGQPFDIMGWATYETINSSV